MKKTVYNLGAGTTPLNYFTNYFNNWEVKTVDLEYCNPDIVSDLRFLNNIESGSADAFWMCHVLEHFYWHEIPLVLSSALRILNDDGIGIIKVPDLGSISHLIPDKLIEPVYTTEGGLDITPLDMIYGSRYLISQTDNDSYRHGMAHKTGFTRDLLNRILLSLGLNYFIKSKSNYEITAVIYKNTPPDKSKFDF